MRDRPDIFTLESLEALQGHSGRASDKLQQACASLLVIRLHRLPEPLDHVAVGGAVLQPRVGLPVVDVDLAQTTHNQLRVTGRAGECDEHWVGETTAKKHGSCTSRVKSYCPSHLQLLLVEGLEQVLGYDLVEAFLQRQELRLDAAEEAPVDVEAHVLLLGVLRDRHVLAVGLELVLDELAVCTVLHTEGVVQHARDVVVPGARETDTGLVFPHHFRCVLLMLKCPQVRPTFTHCTNSINVWIVLSVCICEYVYR